MGGDGPLLHLVRRVLDGREHVDVLVLGHDDDARRVLARGHLHVEAALAQPLDLRPAQGLTRDLGVVVHALKALLLRDAGDGARPVGVVLAEHLLHVLVGPVLVLAGEVEVDIGGLVPLEAQEDLEGDLEPVLFEGGAADGAGLVGQIDAGVVLQGVDVKVAVLAVGAHVVGRQGVHLGDARHGGHEGAAHGASGAHQIPVGVGLVDQPLGHEVQGGEVVADDGLELLVEALLHHVGQGVAVDAVGLVHGHAGELVLRVGDHGGVGAVGEGLQDLDLVGDGVGVVNDHLLRPVAQVRELRQHLLGGLEAEVRLIGRVVEAQLVEQYLPVDGVLRL